MKRYELFITTEAGTCVHEIELTDVELENIPEDYEERRAYFYEVGIDHLPSHLTWGVRSVEDADSDE